METDWIQAGTSGATIDGRNIDEQFLYEMAETYSTGVYTANVNLEHIRGIDPNSLFKTLGYVSAVKAEQIKGGALAGKVGLFVKLRPHPDLIGMVRNGQKVYLSMEIDPKFADSEKAYLVGVGVTDSPASLGVGMMKFNANQRNNSLFSTPTLAEFNESADSGFEQFAAQFSKLDNQQALMLQLMQQFKSDFSALKQEITEISKALDNFSTGRFVPRKPPMSQWAEQTKGEGY